MSSKTLLYGHNVRTVPNIQALRDESVKGLERGAQIGVGGTDQIGDFGGGVYQWVPTSVLPDDGQLVIMPTSNPRGRWHIIGLGGKGTGGVYASPNQVKASLILPDGMNDNTVALREVITAGDVKIYRRDFPYVISTQIVLPAGRTVEIEPGTEFIWTGAKPTISSAMGAFRMSNDTQIVSSGGEGTEWTVSCATSNAFVSAVSGLAVKNVRIVGCYAINMSQAYFECKEDGTAYDDVVTNRMKANGDTRTVNTNQNIYVIGGGAIYPGHTPNGGLGLPERAGAFMVYCENWEVRDARYQGCYAGVQYWGGDSGLEPFQDMGRLGPNAERKNNNGRMINLVGRQLGAGFWGSMGEDIQVTNCRCYIVGDVGHDHEGSINVTMVGCHGEDCVNGAYATFSLNRGISILNCTGQSNKKEWPLFRIFNKSQGQDNDDITINGGYFECTDSTGPGTFDSNFGPARQITITGCSFKNVFINLETNNLCRVNINGNTLNFPYVAPAAMRAITVSGVTFKNFGNPEVFVSDNYINSEVTQPAGSLAIYVGSVDFNSFPHFHVSNNSIWMPVTGGFAAMKAYHSGQNTGQKTTVFFFGNRTDGPIQTTSAGAASPGIFNAQQNYTTGGVLVGITAV